MKIKMSKKKAAKSASSESPIKKVDITISDLLDSFTEGMIDLLKKTVNSYSGQVIMGYRSLEYNNKKNGITSDISIANQVLGSYIKLFNGKKSSIETFDELCLIDYSSTEKSQLELKLKYLDWNKIQIPNFPNFKASKLLEAYDFSTEEESLIESISESLPALHNVDRKYFNEDAGEFTFTQSDDDEISSKYTLFASDQKLAEIISLHLFCEGLSNLKTKEYSFKELPEIDHRLMSMIKIEMDRHNCYEVGIGVDIDKLNNPELAINGGAYKAVTQSKEKSIFNFRKKI